MTHPHFIPSHQPEDSESANPKFNYVFQMYGFMLGNIKHEGNGIWNRFNIIVGINIGLFGIIAFFNSDQTNSWQEIAIGIGAVGFIHSVWSIYVLRQLWRWHEYWREALIKIEKTFPEESQLIRPYSEVPPILARGRPRNMIWLLSYTQPFLTFLSILWLWFLLNALLTGCVLSNY